MNLVRHRQLRGRIVVNVLCVALSMAIYTVAPTAHAQAEVPAEAVRQYDIPAGPLSGALSAWGAKSGRQLVFAPDLVAGKTGRAVSGPLTAGEALNRLLDGSGLGWEVLADSTVVLKRISTSPVSESRPAAQQRGGKSADEPVTNMAEILVKSSRSLNADIRRTINDPQPYVVFEREDIERSGASSLNDFILSRVSANAANAAPTQSGQRAGDFSSIDLRGMGEGQTLVLIDGRRSAPTFMGSTPGQANLNGIPLAAVERIEVLPTTASAIYGGSATGGVINVVLRRDYRGGELAISHDNSFDTDSSINRIDFSYGSSLGEKTTVLLSGSYSEANLLLKRDRDFRARGFEHIYRNYPSFLSRSSHLSTSPNIVSTSGENLTLIDGTSLNSPITFAPRGYLGVGSDGGSALIANAGRINIENDYNGAYNNGGSSFGTAPRNSSLSLTFRHNFSDRLDGFLDLSMNQTRSRQPDGTLVRFSLPAGHAFNPFHQAIVVMVPSDELNALNHQRNEVQRASTGLIAKLGRDWAGAIDFTWSKSTNFYEVGGSGAINYSVALADGFNPIVDYYNLEGRTLQPYHTNIGQLHGPSSVYSYNPTLRFSGPLVTLPAGPVSASFLLERQHVKFAPRIAHYYKNYPGERFILFPGRSQDVHSAYAELTVPVIGNGKRSGLRALDLQMAVRYDDYDTVAGNNLSWSAGQVMPEALLTRNSVAATSGLLGIKLVPFTGLTIRASHGTGFVPPNILQLGAPAINENFLSSTLYDPRRGNTLNPVPFVNVSGGNPELDPEYSETISFGVIVGPERLTGFRASLDYTRLRKTGNITRLSNAVLLQHEDQFPDRIQRGANLSTDQPGWAGPIIYFDVSTINAASARYDALDIQLKYGFQAGGDMHVELWGNGTWMLKAEQQTIAGGPTNNLRGISADSGASAPLNFRGFYGVDAEKGSWAGGWAVRHYGSYLVADPELESSATIIAAQGSGGRVPRQVLHDVWGRWRPIDAYSGKGGLHSLLSGVEISGGIRNVFNSKPEVDLSSGYQFYSYLVDPRLRTYYVQVKYAF